MSNRTLAIAQAGPENSQSVTADLPHSTNLHYVDGGCRVSRGIVIVSFNTRELTLDCLRSVAEHEPDACVVVVDNASHDGSADAIGEAFPDVTLLRLDHNLGFGRANTLGMQFLTNDLIILLNSDTVLTDDALHRCSVRLLADPTLGAVTPRLIGVDGVEQSTKHALPTLQYSWQRAMWRQPQVGEFSEFWIPGTCMCLKRRAIEAAGGLFAPELFIYWEDADLCSRLMSTGYRLDVVDDASIIHHGGASGGGPNCRATAGLHEWYIFGRHFWFCRHRPKWEAVCLWLLEFIDVFRCLGRALIRPARRVEGRYAFSLFKTLVRYSAGASPVFAVPDLHGRRDSDLVASTGDPGDATADCGVVVIGRNEGQRLQRCLNSVNADRLVYVDSGSSDGSQQLAVDHGAILVELDMSVPFTAARARNAGMERLLADYPDLDSIQFLDGDCELHAGWLNAAQAAMGNQRECAIVCGTLQEKAPERSIYNRLCQLEWRRPTGRIDACGGIFLARTEALIQSGGFNDTLIAGEEPELCLRLRAQKWTIHAIPELMASHDADMTKFGQWWKRSIRAGFSYAQGYSMHGHRPERFRRREVRSILAYGLAAPLLAVASAWHTFGLSIVVLLLCYRRLYCKVRTVRIADGDFPSDAIVYARFVVIGKFAQAIGVIRFHCNRMLRRRNQLIEYKSA